MARVTTAHKIKKVLLLAQTCIKPNGKPNIAEIARQSKVGLTTARRIIEESRVQVPDDVSAEIALSWSKAKYETSDKLVSGVKAIVERFATSASDPDYDARDLKHLAGAQTEAIKATALVAGDVTSRTQQNIEQTVEHNVKLFSVPKKDTAAFTITEGTKDSLPESYDIEDDS
jgi:hypothetical protein